MHRNALAMAEAIRGAGSVGITEARLAWRFKLALSSVRCNYRLMLLELFPDIEFVKGGLQEGATGTYRSDPQIEAELILAASRGVTLTRSEIETRRSSPAARNDELWAKLEVGEKT
jgi:hypothetical protein